MKKLIIYLMAVVLIISVVTGCTNTSNKTDGKLKVVATMFAAYDFARQISGSDADITILLKPGAESHSYEPTPKDIIKIQECDVFIYVGGENDTWVNDILDSVTNKNMKVIKMLDLVKTYKEETVDGMEKEESGNQEETDTELDEHVWTSPVNAITICSAIKDAFVEQDPDNSTDYEDNYAEYKTKLTELDEKFKSVVNSAKRKIVVFGDRFPLRYFVEEYGLEYYAAFPGCAEQTEANPATVAFLIDKVKSEQIPVVFTIELSNQNMAKTIADDTGAKVMTFYSCHNLSKEDFESGMTYIDFMNKNVDSLREALN